MGTRAAVSAAASASSSAAAAAASCGGGSVSGAAPSHAAVAAAVADVRARIAAACERRVPPTPSAGRRVLLVAVGKTKPVSLLQAAYDAGVRDFGENYVHELVAKSAEMPSDVRWHFIGHLQSNKCRALCAVHGLRCVHSVGSEKTLRMLSKHWKGPDPLRVMVEVNTSGEDTKSGVAPADCVSLARGAGAFPNLRLAGLMTIGRPSAPPDLPDFVTLVKCRAAVAEALGCSLDSLDLSMGMSADFEAAIAMGSTAVRIGSTIFGAREPKLQTQSEEEQQEQRPALQEPPPPE